MSKEFELLLATAYVIGHDTSQQTQKIEGGHTIRLWYIVWSS